MQAEERRSERRRSTFLRATEVLDRAHSLLDVVGDAYVRTELAAEPDDRQRMILDRIQRARSSLIDDLEAYRASTPDELRRHFSQYTAELPEALQQRAETTDPESPEAAAAMMVGVANALAKLFDELGHAADVPTATEVFSGLAQLARVHARRMSRSLVELDDV